MWEVLLPLISFWMSFRVTPKKIDALLSEKSGAAQNNAEFAAPEAVLTGLETRTSSPVRLPRDENGESTDVRGVWPCGEGPGYAGGIMSAAVDGLRAAARVAQNFSPAP